MNIEALQIPSFLDIEALPIPGFREPVNSLSHFGGAAVFAVWGVLLVRKGRGNRLRTISLAILAVASVLQLSLSGVYHLLAEGTAREVVKRLDVAGVFILIAGTITPSHLILFRGVARWAPVAAVWSIVAMGITLRMMFFNTLPSWAGDLFFLALGWGGAIALVVLWRRHGFGFIRPLVIGGLAYTVGVIVLGVRPPAVVPGVIGPHELWHFAVLTGLTFHWRFVSQFASGEPPPLVHEQPTTRRAVEATPTPCDQPSGLHQS